MQKFYGREGAEQVYALKMSSESMETLIKVLCLRWRGDEKPASSAAEAVLQRWIEQDRNFRHSFIQATDDFDLDKYKNSRGYISGDAATVISLRKYAQWWIDLFDAPPPAEEFERNDSRSEVPMPPLPCSPSTKYDVLNAVTAVVWNWPAEKQVAFAMSLVDKVWASTAWHEWRRRWLSGEDRTSRTAREIFERGGMPKGRPSEGINGELALAAAYAAEGQEEMSASTVKGLIFDKFVGCGREGMLKYDWSPHFAAVGEPLPPQLTEVEWVSFDGPTDHLVQKALRAVESTVGSPSISRLGTYVAEKQWKKAIQQEMLDYQNYRWSGPAYASRRALVSSARLNAWQAALDLKDGKEEAARRAAIRCLDALDV